MYTFDLNIAMAGLAVGVLVGLTGMGGGALMTPLLVFLFGVPPATAVATDLFKAIITKGVGALQHLRQGTADVKAALQLARGSLPGALLGGAVLFWLGRYGAPQAVDAAVLSVLGFTLILAGAGFLIETRRLGRRRPEGEGKTGTSSPPRWAGRALLCGGGVIGFLVALTSVGAGSLGIALLGIARRVPGRKLVGTDLLHGFLLVTVATLAAHGWADRIDFQLAANLLLGTIPGAVLGARICARTPVPVLRPILAVMLMITGFSFLL